MKAIVLSGGGARGAYEIGVWKALRKLHIKYDIVTGTSIGALNGALMTQNTYFKARKIWNSVDYSTIIDKKIETPVIKTYVKGFINDGGIDTKKLEKLIILNINESRVRKSKINYGLVTYNMSKLKAKELSIKEIENGKLCEYLVASLSCFPALKPKNLDNNIYVDGGVYDNMPINLAIKMGATEILAIDLEAIGVKRKPINKSIPISYISPNNDIVPFLEFDNKKIRDSVKFGFNDTMKFYDKLDGKIFTFKKNDLQNNYNRYYEQLKISLNKYFDDHSLIDKISKIIVYKKIININDSYIFMNELIENLGKILNLDETKIYNINHYNRLLKDTIENLDDFDFNLIEEKIKSNKIKTLLNTKWIVKYIYEKLKKEKDIKNIFNIAILFSKEFLEALYLNLLENY